MLSDSHRLIIEYRKFKPLLDLLSLALLNPESISVSNQGIHRALGAYPLVPDWMESNLSELKHARHKEPGF
jgi:hypothetical protein